tara:strand:- start:58616 stop:58858 length:243 start_codon:yes stop_codon:yes gene_type:complete
MDCDAENIFMYMKNKIKALGLRGFTKCRINKAGCFDRCKDGPLLVIYPDDIWYRYIDQNDIDEIISEHIVKGNIVRRLLV